MSSASKKRRFSTELEDGGMAPSAGNRFDSKDDGEDEIEGNENARGTATRHEVNLSWSYLKKTIRNAFSFGNRAFV